MFDHPTEDDRGVVGGAVHDLPKGGDVDVLPASARRNSGRDTSTLDVRTYVICLSSTT